MTQPPSATALPQSATTPLTADALEHYAKACTRKRAPQAYCDAFHHALAAASALDQPDARGRLPPLVAQFWQTTAWLGVYRHLGRALADLVHAHPYHGPGSDSLAKTLGHITHIADVWGPDFWHHLRRRRVRLPAVPSKNIVEQIHKETGRNVSLADFAGRLARWLPEYYARHDTHNHAYFATQLAKGKYVLQRVALVSYLDAVDRGAVEEVADAAGSDDDQLGSSETEDDEAPAVSTATSSVPASAERARGTREQPRDCDVDDSPTVFASEPPSEPSSTPAGNVRRAHTPANPAPMLSGNTLDTWDKSEKPNHPLVNPTMAVGALTDARFARSRSEAPPRFLHGQAQSRRGLLSPKRLSRTSNGPVAKPAPSQSKLDHSLARRLIERSLFQPVLDAFATALTEYKEIHQAAENAASSHEDAAGSESKLRHDIGQHLRWDSTPTVKEIHDARDEQDKYASDVSFALAQAVQLREQAEAISSRHQKLHGRVTVVVDVEHLNRDMAIAQSEAKLLGEHEVKLIGAEHHTRKTGEESDRAAERLKTHEHGYETMMEIFSWNMDTQMDFCKPR